MQSKPDDLYFIVSPALNRVKIGRGNTKQRLKSLRTGSPDPDLYIVLSVPTHGCEEKRVHRAWAGSWSHGEWFHLDERLTTWIRDGAPLSALPSDNSTIPTHVSPEHVRALAEMIQ